MKTRVQVYLEARQDLLLERLAQARDVSKARLIRESIDRYLTEMIPPDADPALRIVGLAGKTGFKDLAEKHDKYLAEWERSGRRSRAQGRTLR